MRITNQRWMSASTGAALVVLAGTALGGNLDPSGQAGQYEASRPAVLLKGAGGTFDPSTVYVPFILLNDTSTGTTSTQSNLNGAVVENIGGRPIASVTAFSAVVNSNAAHRVVAMLGTTDTGSTLSSGASNNVILNEHTGRPDPKPHFSNSHGALLPDGTLVTYERFATATGFGQNNIGYWNAAHSLGVAEPVQAPFKVIDPSTVNVGNATETGINPVTATLLGSVFIGAPTAVRDPNVANPVDDNNLITANTHFNGSPALSSTQRAVVTNGVSVYRGRNNMPTTVLGPSTASNCTTNSVYPYAPATGVVAAWLQSSVPTPTNPPGECRTDARQTKPCLAVVRTPAGADKIYCVHGIGFSGGTPFTGGSARPILLAVDTITNPDGSPRMDFVGSNATKSFNTILIEADATGGVGALHGRPYDTALPLAAGFADHFNSDLGMKFIDSQATGGSGGPSTNTMFDMNRKGQIAAVWVDENQSPDRYEVRVYDPVWDTANDRIEGYTLSAVVTFNGDMTNGGGTLIVTEAVTTIQSTPGVFIETSITPISGVAIDDNGRVAFVGIREVYSAMGNWDNDPFTPDTSYLQNTTNALMVWDPGTDTIHEILRGGQTGDTLADGFPMAGDPRNESLDLGFFPVNEDSDSFNREGFSRDGQFLAVNFRSGGNILVNGVNMELETLPNGTSPDTFFDRGGVLWSHTGTGGSRTERAARGTVVVVLGLFRTAVPVCCPGNADKVVPGMVNFADVTAVLTNFNGPANPNGTTPGDADCDGAINFGDVTSVLINFLNFCF